MDDLIEFRNSDRAGVKGWWWPKADNGAWSGPADDFPGLRDLVLSHARGRELILQAGGCCGMYPRLWSQDFDRVVTAEPDPLNFHCLTLNNPDDRIRKINAALGYDRVGVSIRVQDKSNLGMNQVREGGSIPQIQIDDLELDACDVIQLDVEGYEFLALKGGIHTVAKYRPVIVVETLDNDVQQLLDAMKYRMVGQNRADKVFRPS